MGVTIIGFRRAELERRHSYRFIDLDTDSEIYTKRHRYDLAIHTVARLVVAPVIAPLIVVALLETVAPILGQTLIAVPLFA